MQTSTTQSATRVELARVEISNKRDSNSAKGMRPFPALDVAVNDTYKNRSDLNDAEFAELDDWVRQLESALGRRSLQDFIDVRATVPRGRVERFARWVVKTIRADGYEAQDRDAIASWLQAEIAKLVGGDEAAKWMREHPVTRTKAPATAPARIVRTPPRSGTAQPKPQPKANGPRNEPAPIQPAAIQHTFAERNPEQVLETARVYLTVHRGRLSDEALGAVEDGARKATFDLGGNEQTFTQWLGELVEPDKESKPERASEPATEPTPKTSEEPVAEAKPSEGRQAKPRRKAGPRRQGRNSSHRDDGQPGTSAKAREKAPKPKSTGRPDDVSEETWALAEEMAKKSNGDFDTLSCVYEASRQLIEAAKSRQTAQAAQ